MKTLTIHTTSLVLALVTGVACSSGEQALDKRQTTLIDVATQGAQSGNAEGTPVAQLPSTAPAPAVDENPAAQVPAPVVPAPIVIPSSQFASPVLVAAKGLETVKVENVIHMNKVSADETIIFLKDGKSYSYKPAATGVDILKPIEPIVDISSKPGTTLYSLPNSQFWYISADEIGRHKQLDAGTVEKQIYTQKIDITSIKGDRSKLKVLSLSLNIAILQNDTTIAIVNAKEKAVTITQFVIAELQAGIDLKGSIQAGETDSGYWFRSKDSLYLLAGAETAGVIPWIKSALTLAPADVTLLAMRPDAAGTKTQGSNIAMSAAGFFSDVPAAVTPAAVVK